MKSFTDETRENQKTINKMFHMFVDKTRHAIFYHGAGFCQECGELRKRCECKIFVEAEECKCGE